MAGCTAALWAQRLAVEFAWFEATDGIGGQLNGVFSPIIDYPLFPAHDGAEFRAGLASHLAEAGLSPRMDTEIVAVETGSRPALVTSAGDHLAARAVLVATGIAPLSLGLEGETSLAGVSRSATRDCERAAGSRVVVVGGGDGGVENAAVLQEAGCRVTLVHRGSALTARPDLVARLDEHTEVLRGTTVTGLHGSNRLEAVTITSRDGLSRVVPADWLFVKIGFAPRSSLVAGVVERDEEGFVLVDGRQRTSASGVLAAGDVCTPRDPALAVCAGQAVVAVKTARRL